LSRFLIGRKSIENVKFIKRGENSNGEKYGTIIFCDGLLKNTLWKSNKERLEKGKKTCFYCERLFYLINNWEVSKCTTVLPRLSEDFWDNLTKIHIIENSLNRINEYDTKRKNDKSFSVMVRSNVFTRVNFFFNLT
jgi:hypothetical protein